MSSAVAPRSRTTLSVILVVVLALLAGLSVLAAAAAGGGNLVLLDAGPVARHGAPIASTLADLAAALTLGGAVIAGWLLRDDADRARVLIVVAVAAAITTLARGASLVFSYAVATGQPVGSPRFGSDLGVFVTTDLGIWLLTALVVAAATTTVAVLGSSVRIARTVAVLAGLIAFCAAMTGHAAGDETHEVGTSTMLIHLLAVGIWVGGLAVLQLLPDRGRDDGALVRGYSHLALICWAALALSGVWALAVRMNHPGEILTSPYVQLGIAKAVLLLLLGGLGVLQRRQIAEGFGADQAAARGAAQTETGTHARATYRRLALLELALMGLAVALAAAMSSSPPPAEAGTPPGGAAGVLTGYPLPAMPEFSTVLTAWRPDPFGMALACVLVLSWWRPRAPQRPRAQTLRLLAGAAALVLVTSGPLNVYGKVLVSAHVLQHVLLMVPAGVLLGSVGTVPQLLRARFEGRWWAAVLLAVAGPSLLIVSYVSPFLRLALDGHAAHLALQLLALAGGALTALALRAVPSTAPRWQRLLLCVSPLLLGLGAGVTLMLTDSLLAASWFGATGRTWWADALADQQRAGIAMLVVVAVAAVIVLVPRRRRSEPAA